IQIGDRVMLKVSPWKGVAAFWKTGKVEPEKCLSDDPLAVPLDEIHIDDKEPVEILEREIKKLRRSRIPIIKVRWNSKRGPEIHVGTRRSVPRKVSTPLHKNRTLEKCCILSLGTRLF
ncbi:hypothetical protein Tco_0234365, partial [Tanacetum coccineum]